MCWKHRKMRLMLWVRLTTWYWHGNVTYSMSWASLTHAVSSASFLPAWDGSTSTSTGTTCSSSSRASSTPTSTSVRPVRVVIRVILTMVVFVVVVIVFVVTAVVAAVVIAASGRRTWRCCSGYRCRLLLQHGHTSAWSLTGRNPCGLLQNRPPRSASLT